MKTKRPWPFLGVVCGAGCGGEEKERSLVSLLFFSNIYLFIYLAALGLGCGTRIFVAACRIFVAACGIFSSGMWESFSCGMQNL